MRGSFDRHHGALLERWVGAWVRWVGGVGVWVWWVGGRTYRQPLDFRNGGPLFANDISQNRGGIRHEDHHCKGLGVCLVVEEEGGVYVLLLLGIRVGGWVGDWLRWESKPLTVVDEWVKSLGGWVGGWVGGLHTLRDWVTDL